MRLVSSIIFGQTKHPTAQTNSYTRFIKLTACDTNRPSTPALATSHILLEMTAAQVRIATTLEQFYDETEPMGVSGVKYKDAVTKMETQAHEEVVSKNAF